MEATPPYAPLVNPDRRPLPSGWTQHYEPDRKLWIYLDMNVLPPRATLMHPAGQLNIPARGIATQGRSTLSAPTYPARESHRTSIQTPRQRQDKTLLAHQLYPSALPPPIKKSVVDEFGSRTDYDANESAPSYNSINASTLVPFASPAMVSAPTLPVSALNTRRTPRRPLPRPPVSNSTVSHPLPRPPDPIIPEAPVQGPLQQPIPVRPPNGLHVPRLAEEEEEDRVIPQQEPEKSSLRAKPPSYSSATKPSAMRQSMTLHAASRSRLILREHDPIMEKAGSLNGSTSLTSTQEAKDSSNQPALDQEAPKFTSTIPPSESAIPLPSSSLSSEHLTISRLQSSSPSTLSLSNSTSPRLSPSPAPTGRVSAPSSPEPLHMHLTPNRRQPYPLFAPLEIVALVNRHMRSPSMAMSEGQDAFDPTTLYSDSPSASRQTLTTSPASNPRSVSTPPTSTRTSLSLSPMPSQHSGHNVPPQPPLVYALPSSSTASIFELVDTQDLSTPEPLIDPSTPIDPEPRLKSEKSSMFKQFGLGFSKMASKGTSGLKGVLKKGRVSNVDLLSDPIHTYSDPSRISADVVGKVIDDGFLAVMDVDESRSGPTKRHKHGLSQVPSQLSFRGPIQPQNTNNTLRPTPSQGQAQASNDAATTFKFPGGRSVAFPSWFRSSAQGKSVQQMPADGAATSTEPSDTATIIEPLAEPRQFHFSPLSIRHQSSVHSLFDPQEFEPSSQPPAVPIPRTRVISSTQRRPLTILEPPPPPASGW